MARIEGVRSKNATLLTRILYFVTRRKLGRVVMPIKVKAHHPRLLRAYAHMELGQQAVKTVSAQLKTLVQVKVAMMIGCPFWIDIGSAVGREQGVTESRLAALNQFESSAEFSEDEKVALRYAEAMSATPVVVPDELFDKLRAHFDERQLVELTSAIAWENYRARFDHAFGIEAEGFSEGSYCPLPQK